MRAAMGGPDMPVGIRELARVQDLAVRTARSWPVSMVSMVSMVMPADPPKTPIVDDSSPKYPDSIGSVTDNRSQERHMG